MHLKRKRSDPALPSSPPPSTNSAHSPASVHASGRTLKRRRDDRPPEEQVHQRTLRMLYSARQDAPPVPAPDEPAPANHPPTQQSLHRFWRIRSAPSSGSPPRAPTPASACEDCGAEPRGEGPSACGACGKRVCFGCSVSNLGERVRCLRCAGR
ncbi:hypothetical protein E4U53_003692 [Claviceps sorghi]|nr:hypothetical protein E4U53_003692 [Claviceps sorghi]